MNFAYAAVKQMEGKYLIQNRVTKRIYESPQFLYLLVAMCLFAKYPAQTRLGYVKRFYDAVSRFKISLPTPIMAGVRTPMRQFSSCVLIECDDDLDSVNATTSAIVKYVSQRAGIGINGGRIRALGSEIRGGEALHTGCLPFFKMFQAAVKSCSQGGGAAARPPCSTRCGTWKSNRCWCSRTTAASRKTASVTWTTACRSTACCTSA